MRGTSANVELCLSAILNLFQNLIDAVMILNLIKDSMTFR